VWLRLTDKDFRISQIMDRTPVNFEPIKLARGSLECHRGTIMLTPTAIETLPLLEMTNATFRNAIFFLTDSALRKS
jgi:hypothetical protein